MSPGRSSSLVVMQQARRNPQAVIRLNGTHARTKRLAALVMITFDHCATRVDRKSQGTLRLSIK